MEKLRAGAALLLALAGAGCASSRLDRARTADDAVVDWRRVATPADRARIRDWRTAFSEALAQANGSGHASEVAREGTLLDPDAGRAAAPPPGDYRCRVIKLGSKGPAGLGYVAYPAFACRIEREGRIASFRKLTGSQRPVGVILDEAGGAGRPIFLGTLMLGDEQTALDYGRDPDRDLAGAFEQLGPARWRLLLPRPRFESVMDVIELVPAG